MFPAKHKEAAHKPLQLLLTVRSTHWAEIMHYTKLSASSGHPNRHTWADTFVLAAGPDLMFVLQNRDCHVVRKPLRWHREKDVESSLCGYWYDNISLGLCRTISRGDWISNIFWRPSKHNPSASGFG